ncbi:MAG: SDR family oxidoreductase [Planctomycetes bacterium]|nr:SDR family oxidoreductase [Planctomycetota bacterium]
MLTLTDRTAIVTGAAQGLGFAMAKMLAENGMAVALVDINGDKAAAAHQSLAGTTGDTAAFACDITDDNSIAATVAAVADRFGGIDVVVNCAGIATTTPVEAMTRKEWDTTMAVNLGGTFFMSQAAIPHLKKSRAGRIINISSNAGRMGGYESSLAYGASKGGVIALTFGLARQLAPFGITVNAVCPGTAKTEMAEMYSEEKTRLLISRIPLGRLGSPEDNAAAVCYLASEEAGFVTGTLLDVNGGMYMG